MLWSNGKLEEGIQKPVQSIVVMEIRWKLHCQVVDLSIRSERKERTEKLVTLGVNPSFM